MNLFKMRNFKPMELLEIKEPFNSKDYIYELKFDGIRALMFVNKSECYLQSRNQNNLTNKFSNIVYKTKTDVIFDGEIIALKNGKPSFAALKDHEAIFMAFDIIYENKDLTNLPLITRKKILNKYADNDFFIKVKFIEEKGKELFKKVQKLNLEGIVIKNKNGFYHINERTDDFIKVKNIHENTFYIGGYIKNKTTYSLLIGEFINDDFIYLGKVAVNKSNQIITKIKSLNKIKNPFVNYSNNGIFIKPILKCKIAYLEKTNSNKLRHPIFRGETC